MSWYFWLFVLTLGLAMLSLAGMVVCDFLCYFKTRSVFTCAFFMTTIVFAISAFAGGAYRESRLHDRIMTGKAHWLRIVNSNDAPFEYTYLEDTLFHDGEQTVILMPGEHIDIGCSKKNRCRCVIRCKLLDTKLVPAKQQHDKLTVAMRYKQLTEGK